jgi:hypothetical protein
LGAHPHQSKVSSALEKLEPLFAKSEYVVRSSSRAAQKFAMPNGRGRNLVYRLV